jgi:hypothetical protein
MKNGRVEPVGPDEGDEGSPHGAAELLGETPGDRDSTVPVTRERGQPSP